MAEKSGVSRQAEEDASLAAPPDDENEAIIDAHKAFVATMIGAALFVGSVVAFIL